MNKIVYILILLMLSISSCYKDKGHYDYKKINEITISGIEDRYEKNVGDHFVIKPELKFKLDEKVKVSYRWRLDTVVISDSAVLDMEVGLRVKDAYYGDFSVIDEETGIAYMKAFKLAVSSKYRSGWLLLSEKDDCSKLDYITEEREAIEDIYYNINEKHLPTSCRRMVEDLHSSWDESALGQVIIMSDEGLDKSVVLDGASFSQVITLNEEFVDGKAPEGLIPMGYATGMYYRHIVDQNGKVYVKYSQKGVYQEGYYNQFPAMGDYKVLPITAENYAMRGIKAATLFFDVSNPQKGYNYMYGLDGEMVKPDTTKDTERKFDLLGMNKKVLAMGPNNNIGTNGKNYFSVILRSNDDENKYFVQSLGFGMVWGRTPWMVSHYETEFPDPSIINENSVFAIEFGRERIYIGTGSKLYVYDMFIGEKEETDDYAGTTKSITPLYDFGTGKTIRSISCGFSQDRGIYELGVAVENGNQGDFYLMDVSSEGISTPWKCKFFKAFEGIMGRPLQVRYKIGDPDRLYLF